MAGQGRGQQQLGGIAAGQGLYPACEIEIHRPQQTLRYRPAQKPFHQTSPTRRYIGASTPELRYRPSADLVSCCLTPRLVPCLSGRGLGLFGVGYGI